MTRSPFKKNSSLPLVKVSFRRYAPAVIHCLSRALELIVFTTGQLLYDVGYSVTCAASATAANTKFAKLWNRL